jgi:FkbM family methyltransferase
VHLSSLGFQNGAQQAASVQAALHSLGTVFVTRDFDSLYRCSVGLIRDDGTTASTSLSSANSQLHGLNAEAKEFQFGYEADIAAVIDFFVPNDGTLLDVGANFGYFSIYLASRKAFCGTVHAFEPSARGLRDLEALVSGFNLGDRIQIHRCALGDADGETELLQSNSDGLTTMVTQMANRLEKAVGKQTVELCKLDAFTFQRIDLIKIDVEGAETMVIAGGLNSIKAHLPVVVFESWASFDDRGAFDQLRDCGYRFLAPTWENQKGQMNSSIHDAVDPTKLVLVLFQPAERSKLPERINVVAIHADCLEQMFGTSTP